MGGASSTLARARKIVMIRAYNARPTDQTVDEQFAALATTNKDGLRVIRAEDIKAAVGLSQPWFDDLLTRIAGGNTVGEIAFDTFVDFLETGAVPTVATVAEPKGPLLHSQSSPTPFFSGSAGGEAKPPQLPPLPHLDSRVTSTSPDVHRLNSPTRRRTTLEALDQPGGSSSSSSRSAGGTPTNAGGGLARSSSHPTLVRMGSNRRIVRDARAEDAAKQALYPDVWTCLGFRAPTECREIWHHPGTTLNDPTYRRPGPQRPLWRKRETVVHERIVQYTTVDEHGTVQELVESEKTQNEVVHLECKETGEFAHRESAEYEQTETFNNEIVAAERGDEMYIHMKSKDDEFEHLESNMPKAKKEQRQAEAEAAAAAAEAAAKAEEEMFQQQQYQAAAAAAAAAGLPMPAMPPSMMQGMGMPAVPAVPEGVDPEEYAAYLHAQHQAAISEAEAAEAAMAAGEGDPEAMAAQAAAAHATAAAAAAAMAVLADAAAGAGAGGGGGGGATTPVWDASVPMGYSPSPTQFHDVPGNGNGAGAGIGGVDAADPMAHLSAEERAEHEAEQAWWAAAAAQHEAAAAMGGTGSPAGDAAGAAGMAGARGAEAEEGGAGASPLGLDAFGERRSGVGGSYANYAAASGAMGEGMPGQRGRPQPPPAFPAAEGEDEAEAEAPPFSGWWSQQKGGEEGGEAEVGEELLFAAAGGDVWDAAQDIGALGGGEEEAEAGDPRPPMMQTPNAKTNSPPPPDRRADEAGGVGTHPLRSSAEEKKEEEEEAKVDEGAQKQQPSSSSSNTSSSNDSRAENIPPESENSGGKSGAASANATDSSGGSGGGAKALPLSPNSEADSRSALNAID